jgi:hypothetical protein
MTLEEKLENLVNTTLIKYSKGHDFSILDSDKLAKFLATVLFTVSHDAYELGRKEGKISQELKSQMIPMANNLDN